MAKQAAEPAPPPKFAPDDIVESIQAFWTRQNGVDVFVRLGARMRASETVVQEHLPSFVKDGSTDEEKQMALRDAQPEREIGQHLPVSAPPPTLRDEDAAIAIHRLLVSSHMDGMRHLAPAVACEIGDRLPKADHFVRDHPGDFVLAVPQKGMTRANSLRATETVVEYRKEPGGGYVAEGPMIRKGQWALKDDPLVLTHQSAFEEIPQP